MKTTKALAYILTVVFCMPSHLVGAQATPSTSNPEKKSFWSAKKIALTIGAALTTIASVAVGVGYKVSQPEKKKPKAPEFKGAISKEFNASYFAKAPKDVQYLIFKELINDAKTPQDIPTLVKTYSDAYEEFKIIADSERGQEIIKEKEVEFNKRLTYLHELQETFKKITNYHSRYHVFFADEIYTRGKKSQSKETAIYEILNHYQEYKNNVPEQEIVDFVAILLSEGAIAEITHPRENHDSTFMIAVLRNAFQIADLLLQVGADINRQNDLGESALILAARYKDQAAAQFLLSHGADINLQNNL